MEIWKDVVGYEGLYEVSNLGRVRSVDRITIVKRYGQSYSVQYKGRILRPQERRHGYLAVCLYGHSKKDKRFNQVSVHRLVAEAFLDNPKGFKEVNHINEDKQDNRLCNLEWVSHGKNMTSGTLPKRLSEAHFDKSGKPIIQIDQIGNVVNAFPSARSAERNTGISYKAIWFALQDTNRKSGGYYWRYAK